MGRKVYLIGSLRNPGVQDVARLLRGEGHEVFDDWQAAGPQADDYWKDYEVEKGHTFVEALKGAAAQHVFEFDKKWLEWADTVVLVLPAGKSGHLEFGWSRGLGKEGYILLDDDPDRFDVMYNFATGVVYSGEELCRALG